MNRPASSTAEHSVITQSSQDTRKRLVTAAIVLGIGQAGFFDGIVLHQLLQWHHMFSSLQPTTTVAGLELNTFGDGLFHLFDWLVTLTGIFLLWRIAKQGHPLSTSVFVGASMLGFGLFNLVEGLIDHQILGIHHVKSVPNPLIYDMSFLVINGLIVGAGWLVLRSTSHE